MITLAEYNHLRIPDYALPYLVNCDDSGLSQDDKQAIDNYMSQYYTLAEFYNAQVIVDIESYLDEFVESFFTWTPEFGLACNVYMCTILIVK